MGRLGFCFAAIISAFFSSGIGGVVSIASDGEKNLLLEEEKALQTAADFAQKSVVRIETFGGREIVGDSAVAAGPSSGTIVGSDGWVITSLFQFRGDPASITVMLANGERKAARLVARDFARALALLKIDISEELDVAIPSPRSSWQVGQWTVALGKTFDVAVASRSVGILSATDRIFGRAIQTDCKISPHNYGGPLIDLQGRTLGILAPIDPGIATEGEVQQWYDSGIGFAVPLEDIQARLPRMKAGEDIHIGKAGLRPRLNDDFRGPVEVAGIAPGTPAAKAGLKTGDIIRKIGAIDVRWPNHMRHALGNVDAGESVPVTIEREGKLQTVELTLVKELPVYRTPFLGVLADATYRGHGVKIAGLYPDGPASHAGMSVGDIVVGLGGEKIDSQASLDRGLAYVDFREPVTVEIEQGGESPTRKKMSVTATPFPDDWSEDALSHPNGDASASANAKDRSQDGIRTGVVPIVMGDIPNQVFAFVPTNYLAERSHGVLIVLPNPGKVDRKKWVDRWEVFCRDHHFLLVVVESADADAWQREELEIVKRTLQEVKGKYTVDPRRIALGGLGAGSVPAMVLALQNRSLFRAAWLVEGSVPRGLSLPQAEPLESPAMLLQGSSPLYARFVDAAVKLGYRAALIEGKVDLEDAGVDAGQQRVAENFLRSLEWF